MKDIRKDVDEANEIAKFMNKDVLFTHIYVSKFDDQGIYSGSSTDLTDMQQQTEVQVKVENHDNGLINVWDCNKFQDKLIMMRDALQIYEQNEF